MKKICKRMMSSLLAIIMLVSTVGMEVSATEANSVNNDVQMESIVKASNNTMQDATVIGSLPYQQTGSFDKVDAVDYYKFTLAEPGRVTLIVNSTALRDVGFCLYGSDGELIWSTGGDYSSVTGDFMLDAYLDLTAGTYYFGLEDKIISGAHGDYSLEMGYSKSNESFPEFGNGPNNTTSQANAISLKKTYKGQIRDNDDADFYRIKMDRTQNLTMNFTSYIKGEVCVTIYNSRGQRVDGYNQHVKSNESKKTTYELQKGIYYIGIEQGYGEGEYSFSTNVYIKQPKITSVTCTGKGMSVKWDKVVGATKYYVYRRANKGKYSRVATIKSGSKKSYLDKKAKKNGTKYTYKIVAYNPVCGKSKESKKVYSYYLTTPKLTKAIYSGGGFILKWTKNSKCSGYEIGIKNSRSSGYMRMPVSKKGDPLHGREPFVKASIKLYFSPNTNSYYKIRSYVQRGEKKYYSPWSKAKYVKVR